MADLRHVDGLSELRAALAELPSKLAKRSLAKSVAAGAKLVRNEARKKAPVSTGPVSAGHPPPGTLKRAIVMKRALEDCTATSQKYVVAVRQGARYRGQGKRGNLSQDAYYWRFVEFGTANMAAKPFLRPAFEGQKSAAVDAIKSVLAAEIERAVKELAK